MVLLPFLFPHPGTHLTHTLKTKNKEALKGQRLKGQDSRGAQREIPNLSFKPFESGIPKDQTKTKPGDSKTFTQTGHSKPKARLERAKGEKRP